MKTTVKFETRKFNEALKKYIKKSELSAEKVIRKIAFDLLAGILAGEPKANNFSIPDTGSITGRHPVDLGRARAAWYPSVIGLGGTFNFDSRIDPKKSKVSKGKTEGKFINNLKSSFDKYVELTNSVPYILFLEYGYSKQAPAGMLRISMRKMTGRMPKELDQAFLDDWNSFKF